MYQNNDAFSNQKKPAYLSERTQENNNSEEGQAVMWNMTVYRLLPRNIKRLPSPKKHVLLRAAVTVSY